MKLFFRDRMDKGQGGGMQGLALDQGGAKGAVKDIGNHRMPYVGHVDADLMGAAGLKTQPDQSKAAGRQSVRSRAG